MLDTAQTNARRPDLLFDSATVIVTTAVAALACAVLWCVAPLRRRRSITP